MHHTLPHDPAPRHPRLRLVPAPDSAPPYDDVLPGRRHLRLVPGLDRTSRERERVRDLLRDRRPVGPAPRPYPPRERDLAVVRDAPDLPDPRPFAQALVQRLLEVWGGVRPVSQLQRDTTPALFLDLERGLLQRPRATGVRPGARDVRSLHVQEQPGGVAEVCATVQRGPRVAALALRLHTERGRWVCAQVQGL